MFIRNGVLFDTEKLQLIGDVQYPTGWFFDADRRAQFNVIEIAEPVKPTITATQKITQNGFEQVNGVWQAKWVISNQTSEELAATAAQLVIAKSERNKLINDWREAANFSTFPLNGKLIACDSLSRSDIDAVAGNIALFGAFPPGFPGAWKYTDNSYLSLPNIDAFKTMYTAMTTQGTSNFNHSQTLKSELAAATTIDEVQAIVW
jgi:hypothetical protein